MTFCTKCGQELQQGTKFCSNCGSSSIWEPKNRRAYIGGFLLLISGYLIGFAGGLQYTYSLMAAILDSYPGNSMIGSLPVFMNTLKIDLNDYISRQTSPLSIPGYYILGFLILLAGFGAIYYSTKPRRVT